MEQIDRRNGLTSLCPEVRDTQITIEGDNIPSLAQVRKKGGTKCPLMTHIATEIWDWALSRGVTLLTKHIPGKENTVADSLSRLKPDTSDWRLDPVIWNMISQTLGPLHLDLFARFWNRQTERFIAWRGHPRAEGIDAFSLQWPMVGAYAFPPFGLISRTLKKVQEEQITLVIITLLNKF